MSNGRLLAVVLGAVVLAGGGFLVGRRDHRPTRERRGEESAEATEQGPEPPKRNFPPDLPRFVLPVPVQVPAPAPSEGAAEPAARRGPTAEQLAQQRALQVELDRVMLDEVAPLRTEADLSRYLATIVDRALAQKTIPVTVVEPGRAAIARVITDPAARLERENAFLRSLEDVRTKIAGGP